MSSRACRAVAAAEQVGMVQHVVEVVELGAHLGSGGAAARRPGRPGRRRDRSRRTGASSQGRSRGHRSRPPDRTAPAAPSAAASQLPPHRSPCRSEAAGRCPAEQRGHRREQPLAGRGERARGRWRPRARAAAAAAARGRTPPSRRPSRSPAACGRWCCRATQPKRGAVTACSAASPSPRRRSQAASARPGSIHSRARNASAAVAAAGQHARHAQRVCARQLGEPGGFGFEHGQCGGRCDLDEQRRGARRPAVALVDGAAADAHVPAARRSRRRSGR